MVRAQMERFISIGVSRFYVSIDGAKNLDDRKVQDLMLEDFDKIASGNGGIEISVQKGKRNKGVALGVMSAIDWFFSKEKFGIIIEDDLLFHDDILEFFLEAKTILENDRNFVMASGSNFFESDSGDLPAYIHYPMIWGWATTREKWSQMRRDLFTDILDRAPFFGSAAEKFFWVGARRVYANRIDTWDLPLAYSFNKRRKRCLLSPLNLVSNVGNDEFASHTSKSDFPLNFPISERKFTTFNSRLNLKNVGQCLDKHFEKKVFRVRFRNNITFMRFITGFEVSGKGNFIERAKTLTNENYDYVTLRDSSKGREDKSHGIGS